MTTEQTPEQRARAAVMRTSWANMNDGPVASGFDIALDRLCTERYLAGKVEGHEEICMDPVGCEDMIHFRAEYAACVDALREAKHG